ncbi:MAG TPA: hypothetical protein VIE67_05930 [Rudaea sp.]|jgi:hypothetical protein|uniref:hypothetical protein n=1 Tax=Rudaea sp. TaxID=2136325 RepID=UPI002F92E9CA
MYKAIISLLAAMLSLSAVAADKKPASAAAEPGSSYSLFDNIVKFHAPADWPVILKKTEGLPQFIAFQVKDPADQGSGESSQVSVEAKLLNDSSIFQALVNAATDKAKQTPGYEQREEGVDATTLRYFGRNGKTRYEYRETWYLDSKIFIHVRCSRPVLAATTPAWTSAYEQGCAQIMRTIRQH